MSDVDLPEFPVLVLSGFMGMTGKHIIETLKYQWDSYLIKPKLYPRIKDISDIDVAIEVAAGLHCPVVCTLVDAALNRYAMDAARKARVRAIDVFGPIIDAITDSIKVPPRGKPGHEITEIELRQMHAARFVIEHDDGLRPGELKDADVVIVAVGRGSKTPVCYTLALEYGLFAANVPIILGQKPPNELFHVDRRRVYFLDLTTERLVDVRQTRLEGMSSDTTTTYYVDSELVRRELQYARGIYGPRRGTEYDPGWTRIVTTKSTADTTAQKIAELHFEKFPLAA